MSVGGEESDGSEKLSALVKGYIEMGATPEARSSPLAVPP